MIAHRDIHTSEFDKTKWAWPDSDTMLMDVFGQVHDIHKIIDHVGRFRTCIQAGGACGVWPLMFSRYFDNVHTFEPHPENFECLMDNCREGNVYALNVAVGDVCKNVGLNRHEDHADNAGTWHTTPRGSIKMVTIDSLHITDVDLIQLDIEGMELEALQGARDTIAKYLPTIVIEEKHLPHIARSHTEAREWLEDEFGYSVVLNIHKDVVMVKK